MRDGAQGVLKEEMAAFMAFEPVFALIELSAAIGYTTNFPLA
jgi:hypothetical protein